MGLNIKETVTVNCLGVVICCECGAVLTQEDLAFGGRYYEVGEHICIYCLSIFNLTSRLVNLSSRKIDILRHDSKLQ